MAGRRQRWKVVVKPPNAKKRQRSFVLVRYPPANAVDENGRRLRSTSWSSGTSDHDEAVCEAERAEARLNAATGLASVRTIEAVVHSYVTGSILSPSYRVNCLSALKAAPGLSQSRTDRLDRHALARGRQEMLAGIGGKRRANTTVNSYMGALRAAWNWAESLGSVQGSWPRLKKLPGRTAKVPFEPEEVRAVLEWLSDNRRRFIDWHAYFSLLADTGVRPGEIVRLKGGAVDQAENRVLITRNKTGRQGAPLREEWINVPPETMALLPKRDSTEWLWPSRGVQARGHVGVNGALTALKKALTACGIPLRGTLDQYSFRRWWVDSADAEGVTLGDAMKQVGHRKPATHYGYRMNSRRAGNPEAVEKVRARRLRSAPRTAPQAGAEHEGLAALTPGTPSTQAASSDCSRETAHGSLSHGLRGDSRDLAPPLSHDSPELAGVLHLGSFPHSQTLARLLELSPETRRALVALATDKGYQRGVINAVEDLWPDELPARGEARARKHGS